MATKTTKATGTTTAPEPAKAATRAETLAILEAKGYAGPTSYTVTTLREVVEWIEAGSPKDPGAVPDGVLFAVYPDLKPARSPKATRLTKTQQGYQEALAEVAALGNDLASIRKWIADNQVQVSA